MLKQKNSSRRGFTIIEVVLVLAIAGLIFLMVFLALPALQRSQRDTERRNKLGEFKTQITQYQSNNRGRVPRTLSEWNKVVDDYMNLSKTKNGGSELLVDEDKDKVAFLDPDGELYCIKQMFDLKDPSEELQSNEDCGNTNEDSKYGVEVGENGVPTINLSWNDNKHEIYVFNYARCDGDGVVPQVQDGSRLIAFVTKLEGSGVYCGEN